MNMQQGSLIRKSRVKGPDAWLFRWSEKSDDGNRIYRKRMIGTVEELPDSASARAKVASLLARVNSGYARSGAESMTLRNYARTLNSTNLQRATLGGATPPSSAMRFTLGGGLFHNGDDSSFKTSRPFRLNFGCEGWAEMGRH
jgi:hypothetical protein